MKKLYHDEWNHSRLERCRAIFDMIRSRDVFFHRRNFWYFI